MAAFFRSFVIFLEREGGRWKWVDREGGRGTRRAYGVPRRDNVPALPRPHLPEGLAHRA